MECASDVFAGPEHVSFSRLHAVMPCAGNGLSFITFVNTVPIDANRTINRFALIRNISQPLAGKVFNLDLWDRIAVDAMYKCASIASYCAPLVTKPLRAVRCTCNRAVPGQQCSVS